MIYDQNIKIIYGCSVFVWRASDTTLLLIFSDVVLARPIELCGCGEDCGSNVPMVSYLNTRTTLKRVIPCY